MIYKLRIVSDEIDDFRRDIIIDSESSFLDLKNAICASVDYDPNQMSSFFICDEDWGKNVEITFEDMGADMSRDIYLMSDTKLDEFIEDVGQKMLFTFDYLADRSFFIQVKDEEFGNNIHEPECIYSRGEAPVQFMSLEDLEDINLKLNSSQIVEDFDDEFGDTSGYDDEDIQDFDEMNY